jgi:hypothetical protein
MQITDNGKQTVTDLVNGGRYDVLESHYKWDCGLSVRDWRYVVRIANIDMDDLETFNSGTDSAPNLIRLLYRQLKRYLRLTLASPLFYCNRKSGRAQDFGQREI